MRYQSAIHHRNKRPNMTAYQAHMDTVRIAWIELDKPIRYKHALVACKHLVKMAVDPDARAALTKWLTELAEPSNNWVLETARCKLRKQVKRLIGTGPKPKQRQSPAAKVDIETREEALKELRKNIRTIERVAANLASDPSHSEAIDACSRLLDLPDKVNSWIALRTCIDNVVDKNSASFVLQERQPQLQSVLRRYIGLESDPGPTRPPLASRETPEDPAPLILQPSISDPITLAERAELIQVCNAATACLREYNAVRRITIRELRPYSRTDTTGNYRVMKVYRYGQKQTENRFGELGMNRLSLFIGRAVVAEEKRQAERAAEEAMAIVLAGKSLQTKHAGNKTADSDLNQSSEGDADNGPMLEEMWRGMVRSFYGLDSWDDLGKV